MSHVGKRPKERRGLRREEEEGLAAPRRRLSPGGGPLGLQLAWGNCPAWGLEKMGMGKMQCWEDPVGGEDQSRRVPHLTTG